MVFSSFFWTFKTNKWEGKFGQESQKLWPCMVHWPATPLGTGKWFILFSKWVDNERLIVGYARLLSDLGRQEGTWGVLKSSSINEMVAKFELWSKPKLTKSETLRLHFVTFTIPHSQIQISSLLSKCLVTLRLQVSTIFKSIFKKETSLEAKKEKEK